MLLSAKKSLAIRERVRALIGQATREYRLRGMKTDAALDAFTPYSGLSRARVHRLFYNQLTEESKPAELDQVSAGYVKAMLDLADFFRQKAEHCERLAYAESVARELQDRENQKCQAELYAQQKFAA